MIFVDCVVRKTRLSGVITLLLLPLWMPTLSAVDTAVVSLHWSFQPIGQPSPPLGNKKLSPIDSFVQARLNAKELSPAPPATRKTIINRLYHDLHGLKPTFEQVQAFLNDERPEAYKKLVNDFYLKM